MGLDGLSMSNLGLHRNLTTAQLANDSEAVANQALENQIPDADGVGKKEKAGKKDPDAAFAGFVPFIADEEKNQEQNQQEEPSGSSQKEQEAEAFNAEDYSDEEEPRYQFKLSADNMIEVYDTKTNAVIKKLSAEEAANSVHSFAKMPSLFFDKEV